LSSPIPATIEPSALAACASSDCPPSVFAITCIPVDFVQRNACSTFALSSA
jgi:hypothetical protein